VLNGTFKDGDAITVDVEDGDIVFRKGAPLVTSAA